MKDLEKWTGVVTEILNMEDLKGQGLESAHKDDQPFVRKNVTFGEIKANDDGTFPWIMSDETVDRDFDIIEAAGWDLSEFSGTLLFGHDYRSLPIGKVENAHIDTKRKALIGNVRFTDAETNPNGAMVQRLVEGGFLKTGSVGFLPMAWEDIQDNDKDGDGEEKEDKAKHKRKPRRRYTKQSLMEFSIVPVPSNPSAIQLAYTKGILGTEDEANKFLKDMFDKTLSDFSEAKNKIMKGVDDLKDALDDEGEEEDKGFEHHEEKGQRLAAVLNRRIDAMVTDERSRGDIIQSMATSAGIALDTVRAILSADIICPPLTRLQGFASALNISASSLRRAAERDGCEYDTRGMVSSCPVIEGKTPFIEAEEKARIRLGAGGDDGHTDSITVDDETGAVAQNTNGGGGHKHGKGSLRMENGVLQGRSEEKNGHFHNATATANAPRGESKEIVSTIKHVFPEEVLDAIKGMAALGEGFSEEVKILKELNPQLQDLAEKVQQLIDDKSKDRPNPANPAKDAKDSAKEESQDLYDMIYESGKKVREIADRKAKNNE